MDPISSSLEVNDHALSYFAVQEIRVVFDQFYDDLARSFDPDLFSSLQEKYVRKFLLRQDISTSNPKNNKRRRIDRHDHEFDNDYEALPRFSSEDEGDDRNIKMIENLPNPEPPVVLLLNHYTRPSRIRNLAIHERNRRASAHPHALQPLSRTIIDIDKLWAAHWRIRGLQRKQRALTLIGVPSVAEKCTTPIYLKRTLEKGKRWHHL
ncbi:uncharacterized protein V1516DRAFT_680888 [Lipomyces oligophaga]|uniref:uncharacterized protein n=1 Tax=Lipomyces oligophaga TaxID=45792 RepID=UPI0034CD2AB8